MNLGPKYRLPRVRSPIFGNRAAAVSDKWLAKPDVIVFDDGREICNNRTEGGKREYRWRVFLMWVRQDGKCCNCRKRLSLGNMTFEHENGRGAGKRDDRIAIFDAAGRLLRMINGASHRWCNAVRGSRRTPIWHGTNFCSQRIGGE